MRLFTKVYITLHTSEVDSEKMEENQHDHDDFGSINRSLTAFNCLSKNFISSAYLVSSASFASFSLPKSSKLSSNKLYSFSTLSTSANEDFSSAFFAAISSCSRIRSSFFRSASCSFSCFSSSRTCRSTLSSSHFFLSLAHSSSNSMMAEVHSSMLCSSFFTTERASLISFALTLASSSASSARFWSASADFLPSSIWFFRPLIFSSISS
mmetsp:Transcript_34294/g.65321  ORF Transcript_34294/g.65321 Transcript_34294/m.65321 type:complete len:210 (-) Transcript_34294:337-966(-)